MRRRSPLITFLPIGRALLWPALFSLTGVACLNRPTYTKDDLAASVQRLCQKEYGFKAEARLVGKTLYVVTALDGLVGRDLGLQRETMEKLEGAVLSSTRVALSTNADLNYLVVKARDSRLGVTVTILRYLPDVKSLLYMRISRSDFMDRQVQETENALEPESPESWHDVTMMEFQARLVASRLQRLFSENPLIAVFLQVRRVEGVFVDGTLSLRLDKFENEPGTNFLVEEILRTAVEDTVRDVVKKYNLRGILKHVRVSDDADRRLLDLEVEELMSRPPSPAPPKGVFSKLREKEAE
ncbi:MAG TPA: hypothetical protein P5079_03730 [Elusimicrobiota bacterium]|nr:hypothetical protein [Elusimicrobiota bacterium]